LAVDLRAGDRGAFMALLSGAPRRVSLFYEGDIPFWRNLLFTEVVHPPAVHVARGAAEQSLRIVRELGIDTANALPMLEVSGHAVDRSRHILSMEGIGDGARWLSANPFSRWAYKELPEKKWVDLLQWLTGSRCVSVVLVGAPGERQKAEHLIRGLIGSSGERIVNLVGKTSLSELSGVLSLSRLHVGVDSAAPHIAAAVGTPTITVYGPTSWRDWAPIGEDHRVIASDLDCVPCRRKGCNGSEKSRCLEELDIEIIKKAIDEKLARAGKGP
jgi:heptosyltransferase-3